MTKIKTTTEGFYFYENKIYYGCYDESQVSGWTSVSIIEPNNIMTDHPIRGGERAVTFVDNHHMLDAEYADLRIMLDKMRSFMNLNNDCEIDFSAVEKRLGVSFPKELKLIYSSIYNKNEYFTSEEHFLPLDEIYVEQGKIVFFKKKKLPVAGYDIESGQLAQYFKREWYIDESDFCCYQFCVGSLITIALENKPVFKKGRCKGKFVTTLNIKKELENFCNDTYKLLSEFNVYGIAVMYSDTLIAWIRSNGFYSDIKVGASDEKHIDALGSHLGDIVWKQ